MDFVAPSLAVGSLADAGNERNRLANGIGAVLSLLEVDFHAGEHHATIPLRDGEALPPATLACATAFVERQLRAGRKVLPSKQIAGRPVAATLWESGGKVDGYSVVGDAPTGGSQ